MSIRMWLGAGLVAAVCAGMVIAQEGRPAREGAQPAGQGQPQAPERPNEDEMHAAWMEIMAPAEEHQRLAVMIGEWDAATKFWMGPGDPMEGAGRSSMEWVLGERFVRQTFSGNFMGMEFEGIGYTGFDRPKKKYVGSWMDNFSTSMLYDEGAWDPATESIVMRGSMVDPMGRTIQGRNVVKVHDQNRITYTMYHTVPGEEEQKVGEITYTRARPGAGGADAHE